MAEYDTDSYTSVKKNILKQEREKLAFREKKTLES